MSEENLIDLALFSITNEDWKKLNPDKKGNIIDHASIFEQVTRISMQVVNKVMIEKGADQRIRLEELRKFAKRSIENQMATLAGRGIIFPSQEN